MSDNIQIEKPISAQIIDKMIIKLKASTNFTESILAELESIDLTNISDVKKTISKETQVTYEDSEAWD